MINPRWLCLSLLACGPTEADVSTFEEEDDDAAQAVTSPFRLVLQDNLWFSAAPGYSNYVINGKTMIPLEPLLGRTASSDAEAKKQELQWLTRYTGADGAGLVISQEWIKPDDRIDKNLRGTFLPLYERYAKAGQWNIFYDPFLAAQQRGLAAGAVDFADPAVRRMWEDDVAYLRTTYFGHAQYWRIRGKPVLYVWAAAQLRNAGPAFTWARQQGVYVLGDVLSDQLGHGDFNQRLPPLDGATGFILATATSRQGVTTGELLSDFTSMYSKWNSHCAGRGEDFMPAASSQYDDTEFLTVSGQNPNGNAAPRRLLARSVGETESLMRAARSAARSIDGTGYVFWGTANNWAEGTTILPTVPAASAADQYWMNRCGSGGCVRRIGNYGFTQLEAVRRAFFPSTPGYSGPHVTAKPVEPQGGRRYRVSATLEDCDVKGEVHLTAGHGVTASSTVTESGIRRRRYSVRFELGTSVSLSSAAVTLSCKNLDGRSVGVNVLRAAGR